MDDLACLVLVRAGEECIHRIRAEQPATLIELETHPEELHRLLGNPSRCPSLPWKSWAHSCVTVARLANRRRPARVSKPERTENVRLSAV
jgi:hypothetical protein